jgi:lipopolysaccharide biosynthesis glycosyltransferase
MDYQGWAVFMDCDMVALGDLSELWVQRDERYAVQVVKHSHRPKEKTKFLGAPQSTYPRKNWSSLMLINCAHDACRTLTPERVNEMNGIDLHGLKWCDNSEIGGIGGLWNVLVTSRLEHPEPVDLYNLKLLHYTLGGPWHGYEPEGSKHWHEAFHDMIAGGNPCASITTLDEGPGVTKYVGQFQARYAAP